MDTLIESLLQTRLYDPFGLLGLHREGSEWVIRVYEPHATQVVLITKQRWRITQAYSPDRAI